MEEYFQRLKQIREEKNMPIEECSAALDIPAQMLAMIEIGELVPTEKQKEAIMAFILEQI